MAQGTRIERSISAATGARSAPVDHAVNIGFAPVGDRLLDLALALVAVVSTMGTADVIPGVSGGTIAFITGRTAGEVQNLLPDEVFDTPLPLGTPITDVYDKAEGTLLIMGEPGAGKSAFLAQLAHDPVLDRPTSRESCSRDAAP